MKVVIDARYLRERPSGIGTYVRGLVETLPGLAPAEEFELWAHRSAPRPLSAATNVRERTVRAEPNSLSTVLWPSRLAPLGEADVFHSPHNVLGRGLPCATVVTVHDLLWMLAPAMLDWRTRLQKGLFVPAAIRWGLERADRVITVSSSSADAILRFAPRCAARLRVIPHGIDDEFAPASAGTTAPSPQAARLAGGEEFFLVVGQNSPGKGHRYAVEAFAAAATPRQRLVLVQRRWPGRGLRALARRRGVLDRLVWLPAVSTPALADLMRSAVALLQPSLAEGFGLPVLEAMACGCPVVASDIGALREVVGDAGCMVPPGDAGALAGALRRLSADVSLRSELRARGIARAQAFSWGRCAQATLEVYREAAAGRRV